MILKIKNLITFVINKIIKNLKIKEYRAAKIIQNRNSEIVYPYLFQNFQYSFNVKCYIKFKNILVFKGKFI